MRQGRATSSEMGSTKTEPVSNAVNPKAVAQIGIHEQPRMGMPKPNCYEGRGLTAPMVGQTNHKAGSQGKR